jgi:uncharacterized protein DUF6970
MTTKKTPWTTTTLRALPCLLLAGAALATVACGSVVGGPTDDPESDPTDVPACITRIIKDAEAGTAGGPHPIAVNEYEYQGKSVYLLTPGCCDQFENLVDARCKKICAPSGGFSGGGDGQCPDFGEAKKTRTLWTDSAP